MPQIATSLLNLHLKMLSLMKFLLRIGDLLSPLSRSSHSDAQFSYFFLPNFISLLHAKIGEMTASLNAN